MVLLEAKAYGLPIVSFDCPTGPSEIIEDALNGNLVRPDDISGMAESVNRLIEDRAIRERYALHAGDGDGRFAKRNHHRPVEDVAEHGASPDIKVVIRMNDNLQHSAGARRISWVDYGKGLAILLVFWGHAVFPEPVRASFYAFHIPVFYFLSGYVFSTRKYHSFGPFLWHRSAALISPA